MLRAGALLASRSGPARPGARAAPRGSRPGPGARPRTGGEASSPRSTSARSAGGPRAGSPGKVAASSERTWTASRTEPGWTRASAAGRRVIVCSAAVSRTSGPWRAARRARCAACMRADDRDPPLGGGEVGLGRLDPGGERARLRRGRGRPRWSRAAPRGRAARSAAVAAAASRLAQRQRLGVAAARGMRAGARREQDQDRSEERARTAYAYPSR